MKLVLHIACNHDFKLLYFTITVPPVSALPIQIQIITLFCNSTTSPNVNERSYDIIRQLHVSPV